MTRAQPNPRASGQPARDTDEERIELRASSGSIPSRSERLRLAFAGDLVLSRDETGVDHRSMAGHAWREAR